MLVFHFKTIKALFVYVLKDKMAYFWKIWWISGSINGLFWNWTLHLDFRCRSWRVGGSDGRVQKRQTLFARRWWKMEFVCVCASACEIVCVQFSSWLMRFFSYPLLPPCSPSLPILFVSPTFVSVDVIDECIMRRGLEAGEINAHSSEVCVYVCLERVCLPVGCLLRG